MTGRQKLDGDTGGMTYAKPIRDRSWDKEHTRKEVLTFRLDPPEREKLVQYANELGIPRAHLIEAFIRYAMKAYANGQLKLKKEIAGYTVRLNGET